MYFWIITKYIQRVFMFFQKNTEVQEFRRNSSISTTNHCKINQFTLKLANFLLCHDCHVTLPLLYDKRVNILNKYTLADILEVMPTETSTSSVQCSMPCSTLGAILFHFHVPSPSATIAQIVIFFFFKEGLLVFHSHSDSLAP